MLTLLERFDSNHPRQTAHYYLSLLGTHPDHRGQGKGMALLAANLAQLDELDVPAYLESSNRANDHRYERLGFVHVGEFAAPGGRPTLACMWRDPAGDAQAAAGDGVGAPPSTRARRPSAPGPRRPRARTAAPGRLETAPAGSVLHAVAEEGVRVRTMTEAIGPQLELPPASIAPEAAGEHFGWLGTFLGLDVLASSERADP